MDVLFMHGAGGWTDDQPMAAELRALLDSNPLVNAAVWMPHFPDEGISAAAWLKQLDRQLNFLGPDVVAVAHSFGASMALLRLAAGWSGPRLSGLVLLAAPFWGSEGWQAEYALPAGFTPPDDLPLFLHHCRDDSTVPFDHLARFAPRMPHAVFRRHETGGHQFQDRMSAVSDDVAALIA